MFCVLRLDDVMFVDVFGDHSLLVRGLSVVEDVEGC